MENIFTVFCILAYIQYICCYIYNTYIYIIAENILHKLYKYVYDYMKMINIIYIYI